MPADPRLLALPSLRRQAEADARENYEASYLIHDPDGKSACAVCWDDMAETEDDPEDYTRSLAIDTHAALLADPTRWQSQAWALRRIGELLWNAPTCTLEHDGETWIIRRDRFCSIRFSPTGWHAGEFHSAVSGIYADTPRHEVLAAILLYVEEA